MQNTILCIKMMKMNFQKLILILKLPLKTKWHTISLLIEAIQCQVREWIWPKMPWNSFWKVFLMAVNSRLSVLEAISNILKELKICFNTIKKILNMQNRKWVHLMLRWEERKFIDLSNLFSKTNNIKTCKKEYFYWLMVQFHNLTELSIWSKPIAQKMEIPKFTPLALAVDAAEI